MGTRFGGTSSAQSQATKVRWLVACLVTLILVLCIAVIFVAQSSEAGKTEPEAVPVAAPVQILAAEVFVPANRVEEGTKLDENLFKVQQMDEAQVPGGAVRKKDFDGVRGKFAKRVINAGSPLVLDDVTELPPLSSLNIPSGYRAVTIQVDARSGVEGFAKANSRVDVLWTYAQDGKRKVSTIVRFSKVLSVGGDTTGASGKAMVQAGTTVSLLVTEKDAKKIELARNLGSLSLSLVGDQEQQKTDSDPDEISIGDLMGKGEDTEQKTEEPSSDGVMYTYDGKTGRQIRYVLRNGRWTQDRNF